MTSIYTSRSRINIKFTKSFIVSLGIGMGIGFVHWDRQSMVVSQHIGHLFCRGSIGSCPLALTNACMHAWTFCFFTESVSNAIVRPLDWLRVLEFGFPFLCECGHSLSAVVEGKGGPEQSFLVFDPVLEPGLHRCVHAVLRRNNHGNRELPGNKKDKKTSQWVNGSMGAM